MFLASSGTLEDTITISIEDTFGNATTLLHWPNAWVSQESCVFLTESSSRVHFQVTPWSFPPGNGGDVTDCKHPHMGFHLLTTVWWHKHGGTACGGGSGCYIHPKQQVFPWSSPPPQYIHSSQCPLSSLCSYILHIMQSPCWDWGHRATHIVAVHQLFHASAPTSTHDQHSQLHLTFAILGYVQRQLLKWSLFRNLSDIGWY